MLQKIQNWDGSITPYKPSRVPSYAPPDISPQAGKKTSSAIHLNYSPVININGGDSEAHGKVAAALKGHAQHLGDYLDRMIQEHSRTAYG